MLRASEALMAGSLLLRPVPYQIIDEQGGGCAIGMMQQALGIANVYEDLRSHYPWMGKWLSNPACNCFPPLRSSIISIMIHLFNEHVCRDVFSPHRIPNTQVDSWTLEQLADWLESVDPTPKETKEEVTDRQHREMSPIGDAALLAKG